MKHLPLAPASLLYKTFREKDVKVNGIRVKEDCELHAGDEVTVYYTEEKARSLGYLPEASLKESPRPVRKGSTHAKNVFPAVPVVYEDEQILCINKPSGVLSQKDTPDSYSIVEYLRDNYRTADHFVPAIVNRLDRNTSGILLAGKSVRSLQQLNEMIRDHKGSKYYLAVVQGQMNTDHPFYLLHRWKKDTVGNKAAVELIYQGSVLPENRSFSAVSADETLVLCRVFPVCANQKEDCSLVMLQLFTGKSHQLRAQLSQIGYPIIGDSKYAHIQNTQSSSFAEVHSQLLHAWRYSLEGLSGPLAYLNGKVLEAPPQPYFQKILSSLFPEWKSAAAQYQKFN